MRAGDLDRRIVLERRVEQQDASGQPIITWTPIATVWAQVQQQSGREFMSGAIPVSERRVVFRMRHRTDVTVLDRVAYDGDEFDLNEVRELGRREGLELHTTARG